MWLFHNIILNNYINLLFIECLLPGKDYFGHDLNGCRGKVDSAKKCQELCQRTPGCFKFTHITSTRTCCLKPALHIPLTDVVGVTSGPKYCSGKYSLKLSLLY